MVDPVGSHDSVGLGCNYCGCGDCFPTWRLEEEIYMNLPDGMEGEGNECLLLLKALYGLVQGA